MKVRAIDADGDWTYGKGFNDYKTNNAAIAQNIATRLRCFLGDCFFALNEGVDWWTLIGSKNQIALNLAISAVILKTDLVTGILQLSTNLDANRKLTLSYEVATVFSQGQSLDTIIAENTYLMDNTGNITV
jgi:hypothetical protein